MVITVTRLSEVQEILVRIQLGKLVGSFSERKEKMTKKDKNKEKKNKVCSVLEALCSAFGLCGDDEVDWEEVDRVDDMLRYQGN